MREWIKIWLIIIAIAVSLFWITFRFIEPAPKKSLTIATGRVDGIYYKYALKYKELLEKEGVKVEIVSTAGSIETLGLLKSKKADVGFVQGGTADEEAKKTLHSIASIYFEPMWLFTRDKNISYIDDLIGKRVSIGEIGSGTKALLDRLLAVNSLSDENSEIFYFGAKRSFEELKSGNLDAFFTVISPTSDIVKEIFKDPNLFVAKLKRVNAYTKRFHFLTSLTIYEGELDLKQNIPPNDITLLSTTASIVVREDLDDLLVRLVTVQAAKYHVDGFPSQKYLDIPIHIEAKKYLENGASWLEKIFPFWIASNIDRLKILIIPALTLLIPLLKGFFPLYNWRSRSKIYRWYKELDKVDESLHDISKDEAKEFIKTLHDLKYKIQQETKVPLAYKREYYELYLHIEYLLKKLHDKL